VFPNHTGLKFVFRNQDYAVIMGRVFRWWLKAVTVCCNRTGISRIAGIIGVTANCISLQEFSLGYPIQCAVKIAEGGTSCNHFLFPTGKLLCFLDDLFHKKVFLIPAYIAKIIPTCDLDNRLPIFSYFRCSNSVAL
jgi:hypothetical protein